MCKKPAPRIAGLVVVEKVADEVASFQRLVKNNGGVTTVPCERALTKKQHLELVPTSRSTGPELQVELDATIADQVSFYRATSRRAIEIYKKMDSLADGVVGQTCQRSTLT